MFAVLVGTSPLWSAPATAVEFAGRVEAAASVPVSSPQTDLYTVGPTFVGSFELGVSTWIDLVAQVGWALQAPKKAELQSGTTLLFGLGVRPKLRLAENGTLGWIEAVGHFNRTGDVNVASVSGALGVTWRLGSHLGIGPFVRVLHLFAPTAPSGFEAHAATLVSGGLSVEIGNTSPPPAPVGAESARPPTPSDPDPDHDGVAGDDDGCPTAPEDRDGFEDVDGCPDPDNDGDGVLDRDDACPLKKGSAETRGCPDADDDQVADDQDACRTRPGPASNGGCPLYRQVKVTQSKLEIDQKIFFAFAKTAIMPRSFPLLDEVGVVLADRDSLCVRIEGHTDSIGDQNRNRVLSDGRAAAVRDFLVGRGIKASRLSSKGYGPDLPLESNASPEGRERNRRVEFVIVPCPEEPP